MSFKLLKARIVALEAAIPPKPNPEHDPEVIKRRLAATQLMLQKIGEACELAMPRYFWSMWGQFSFEWREMRLSGMKGGGWDFDPGLVPGCILTAFRHHPQTDEGILLGPFPKSLMELPPLDLDLVRRTVLCRDEVLTVNKIIDAEGKQIGDPKWDRLDSHFVSYEGYGRTIAIATKWGVKIPPAA
jgi:hypothetical protein